MFDLSSLSVEPLDGRITPVYFGLVVILAIMLGGGLPYVVFMLPRFFLWIIWGLFILFIIILSLQLSIHRLITPAMPLIAWLTVYVCWGTLAATYPVFDSAGRLWFRFLCIIAAMAIVTSHPKRLTLFANATQWGLLVNLLVTAWLFQNPEYQRHAFFVRINESLASDRFAGLWGNANEAGLAALFILVLSHWAKPWIAWLGRISGILVIYLSASRTAFWIAMVLTMLHFIFVASKKGPLRVLFFTLALILAGVGFLFSSKDGGFAFIKENPNLARVLDLSESKTRAQGGESRADLAKNWLPHAIKEPWYGYGLFSSEGDESGETKVRRGFPEQGTHNLYMALFIDAGWVGLLPFLVIIAMQLWKMRQIPLLPKFQRMLFALCLIMLAFGLANHQMVTDFSGWMGFSLIFLLPTSPALNYFEPEEEAGA